MKRPKHVLIYCPVFLPQQSGYVHAFIQLIQTLLNQHIYVDVLTPQLLPQQEHEPLQHPLLRVFRYHPVLPVWGLGLFYHFGKLAGRINEMNHMQQYDLVLIETGDVPLLIASLNQQVLKKMAVRFHSTSDTEYLLYGKHKKYKYRRFFWRYLAANHVKHLAATNLYHLKFAHQHVLQKNRFKSATVITNIINLPQEHTYSVGGAMSFLMLGRMDDEGFKQKGFKQLLEALPVIAEKMIGANATLTIVGDGRLYDFIAKQVEPYPFVKLIRELSHEEILKKLNKTDVVLLPSIYEGVSMFALEALSRANAVIFSNTGGLAPMVDGNGILIEPGNSSALSNAILELLSHRDIKSLQRKSVQIVAEQYNSAIQFEQFLSLYQAVQS